MSFDFHLPDALIAQTPADLRDAARLLHVTDPLADHHVRDLPSLLRAGDLLVLNDTRVIPAQLTARRGDARIGLTLDRPEGDTWHALARNARRLRVGDVLTVDSPTPLTATILAPPEAGTVRLRFSDAHALTRAATLALPPYIHRETGPTEADRERYQTTYAAHPGAVAAPTAGLHFTPELLAALAAKGIARTTVTLHVGAGTFLPPRDTDPDTHRLHAERGTVTPEAVAAIARTRRAGGRIVAIGTTTLRLLEAAGEKPFDGLTDIFLRPGHAFRTADLLLTNFHLPRSTLFMLVCAFAGTDRMQAAYAYAIAQQYRFYSYGDASLLHRV